jgi:hypothetical protein
VQEHPLLSGFIAFVLVLSLHAFVFLDFLPNPNDTMGGDYSFYLPALLDGYIWFHENGLWEVPWFTPSFCGGIFNFPNFTNGYYTVPQFLTFFVDPLKAVRISFVLFAALGFLGFYLLLRRCFALSSLVAFFGATFFMFNGFYAHRIVFGHLGYLTFMLMPLVAFFLLQPLSVKFSRLAQVILNSTLAGLCFALMLESGLGSLMLPMLLSLVVVCLVHCFSQLKTTDAFWRFCGAGCVGLLLSASKLTAMLYLLKNFSRSTYQLPGLENLFETTLIALRSLIISPGFDGERSEAMVNLKWALNRPEWEYSVTFVPFVLLMVWFLSCLKNNAWRACLESSPKQKMQLVGIFCLCFLPLALNTYSPEWSNLLKQIPLLKTSSVLVRWFALYIPIVILLGMLAMQRTPFLYNNRVPIVVLGMMALAVLNLGVQREYYRSQRYVPEEVVEAYKAIKAGDKTPHIKSIGVYYDDENRMRMPLHRNNMLVRGKSQLLCYEPLFGYRLEHFPRKSLSPGPVLKSAEGVLNLKNPACYIWPEPNGCQPGDHFGSQDIARAQEFVAYRPFSFAVTPIQRLANWFSLISLCFVLLFCVIYGAMHAQSLLRIRHKGSD